MANSISNRDVCSLPDKDALSTGELVTCPNGKAFDEMTAQAAIANRIKDLRDILIQSARSLDQKLKTCITTVSGEQLVLS